MAFSSRRWVGKAPRVEHVSVSSAASPLLFSHSSFEGGFREDQASLIGDCYLRQAEGLTSMAVEGRNWAKGW